MKSPYRRAVRRPAPAGKGDDSTDKDGDIPETHQENSEIAG